MRTVRTYLNHYEAGLFLAFMSSDKWYVSPKKVLDQKIEMASIVLPKLD